MVSDCDACQGRLAHDHSDGRECPHAFSSGDWRSCCANEAAKRVELVVASFKARRLPPPDASVVVRESAQCLCAESAFREAPQTAEEIAAYPCADGSAPECRAWAVERLAAELLAAQIKAGVVAIPDDISTLDASSEYRGRTN